MEMHERIAGTSYLNLGRSKSGISPICLFLSLCAVFSSSKGCAMTITLRIVLLLAGNGTELRMIILRIAEGTAKIEDAVFWILFQGCWSA